MKTRLLILMPLAVLGAAAPVVAQEVPPLAGNMRIVSDYRFRGVSQTYLGPAIQGGIDYAHASGIYLGNWNSSVSSQVYRGGSGIEMDFYGGWRRSFGGDFIVDTGLIYYWYPNAEWNGNTGSTTGNSKFDNLEFFAGASFKWISAKVFYALSDYFGLDNAQAGSYWVHKDDNAPLGGRGGSDSTVYSDLTVTIPVNPQVNLIGHYGHLEVRRYGELDYKDWKLGITYDSNGWLLGAAYISTSAKGDWYYTFGTDGLKETANATIVFSVEKTF